MDTVCLWTCAVLVICSYIQLGSCKDLKEKYDKCLTSAKSGDQTPVDSFNVCNGRQASDAKPTRESCISYSKQSATCTVKLIENAKFKDCIGSKNLKTLQAVIKMNDAGRGITCSKYDAENAVVTSCDNALSDDKSCESISKFSSFSEDKASKLAGFEFDDKYCNKWDSYIKCYNNLTKARCDAKANKYFHDRFEVLWKATPCYKENNANASFMISSSGFIFVMFHLLFMYCF